MAIEINATLGPDNRAWQAMFEKAGGAFAQQLSSAGKVLGGGYEKDKKTGEPLQKAGDKLGQLVRMMPAGGAIANVTTAFKQGGMMTGMLTGVVGIVGFVKGLLSQSKIFGAVSGAFFKMAGAMMDIALMPMLPLMMRFLAWFQRTGFALAQEWGKKLATGVEKIVSIVASINKILPLWTIIKTTLALWFLRWTMGKLLGGLGSGLRMLGKSRIGRRVIGKTLGKTAMRYSAGRATGGAVLRAGGMGAVRVVTGTGGARGLTAQTVGSQIIKRKVGTVGASTVAKKAGTAGLMGIGARILGGAAAKRFLAGAAVGAVAGGMMGGLPAIPGAIIGGIAALVIGQGIQKAVNVATGTETTLGEDMVPLLQEWNMAMGLLGKENMKFWAKEVETMDKTLIEVGQHTTILNQQSAQASREFIHKNFEQSYLPETVDAYLGVYDSLSEEANATSKYVRGKSAEEKGGIGKFFSDWGTRISLKWSETWTAISDWWNGLWGGDDDEDDASGEPTDEELGTPKDEFVDEILGEFKEDTGDVTIKGWAWAHSIGWLINAGKAILNFFGVGTTETQNTEQPADTELKPEKDVFVTETLGEFNSTRPTSIKGWAYAHSIGWLIDTGKAILKFFGFVTTATQNTEQPTAIELGTEKNVFVDETLGKFNADKPNSIKGWAWAHSIGWLINTGKSILKFFGVGGNGKDKGVDFASDLKKWQNAYNTAYDDYITNLTGGMHDEPVSSADQYAAHNAARKAAGTRPQKGDYEDIGADIEGAKKSFLDNTLGIWGKGQHGFLGFVWHWSVGWFQRIQESLLDSFGLGKTTGDADTSTDKVFAFDSDQKIKSIWTALVAVWNAGVKNMPDGPTFSWGDKSWSIFGGVKSWLTIDPGTWGTLSKDYNNTSEAALAAIAAEKAEKEAAYNAQNVDVFIDPVTGAISTDRNVAGHGATAAFQLPREQADDLNKPVESVVQVPTQAEKNAQAYQAMLNQAKGNAARTMEPWVVYNPGTLSQIYSYQTNMNIISKSELKKKYDIAYPPADRRGAYYRPWSEDSTTEEEEDWWQVGGTVPGPRGSPQPAMLHGGETVLPTHLGRGWRDSTKGGMSLKRFHENFGAGGFGGGGFGGGGFDGGGGRINMMNKPTTINIMTTESAVATIESIERMQMMDEASFYSTV